MIWLRSSIFNVLFYSWTAIVSLACGPVMIFPNCGPWILRIGQFWARSSLGLLRICCRLDHRVTGLENLPDGPYLVASQHQSAWETLALCLVMRDPAYVLKKELTRIPFFGWVLIRYGMVPVDRKGGASALKTMVRECRNRLEDGRTLLIFPEGTRVIPGSKQPMHPGVAALYSGLEVPVVPAALNSGLFWPKRGFLKRPGTIQLEILPAIEPGKSRKEFMAALQTALDQASQRLLKETGLTPPKGG